MSQSDKEDQERSFPSSIPVRSPSPDLKNRNRILKTISPSMQVRKQMTPIMRDSRGYNTLSVDENDDYKIHEFDKSYEATDIKRLKERLHQQDRLLMHMTSKTGDMKNSKSNEDIRLKLIQKDKIIADLKKVISTLSDKSQISESRSENSRIRVLEIQNQRLGEMVKKFTKKDTQEKKDTQQKLMQQIGVLQLRIQQLATHNQKLEQVIQKLKIQNLNQSDSLNEQNQFLRKKINDLLPLEERNKSLQNQNQRLLKLLSDKKQSIPEITASQQNQIFRLQQQIQALKQKSAPQKMTLSKIKQQYNQSIKLFQQRTQQEVDKQIERMSRIMSDLKVKVENIQSQIPRIAEMHRSAIQSPIKLAQLSKSYVQQTADLNSQIKKQRQQKRLLEDKYDQLQINYDSLMRKKEEEGRHFSQDMEHYKIQWQKDRRKHYEQLDILKNSYQNEFERLKNKYRQQINEFKGSANNDISRVMDNYNQEIQVLKSNLATSISELTSLQTEMLNKEVQYKRNIQIVEERLKNEVNEVTRLINIINQKDSLMKSLRENKQQIQELGEVRKRSQTELQLRYHQIQSKYTQLFFNHSEATTKYSQLLNKYNATIEQLQQLKNQNRNMSQKIQDLEQENQMIPELKNRITHLQEQILAVEFQLQQKNIKAEKLQNQVNKNNEERQRSLQNIQITKSKLIMLGTKAKLIVQNISKIDTQVNLNNEFMKILEEIAHRITKLQKQNNEFRMNRNKEQLNSQKLVNNLFKAQKQLRETRFQVEGLKKDISHLNDKLGLKDQQLNELKLLLQSKYQITSEIYEQGSELQVNLDVIQKLKNEYNKTVNYLSGQILTIKNTVVQEIIIDE